MVCRSFLLFGIPRNSIIAYCIPLRPDNVVNECIDSNIIGQGKVHIDRQKDVIFFDEIQDFPHS